MKKYISFISAILIFTSNTLAQDDILEDEAKRELNTGDFTIGLSASVASYLGDLNPTRNASILNNFRPTFGLQVEKRFGKFLGIGVNGLLGSMSQNEQTAARQLNFETKFMQAGACLIGNFDWKADVIVAPYFSVGVSYIDFTVNADLKGAEGSTYHYWSDGTIRALPQKDENGNIITTYTNPPREIERDYTYESEVNTTFDPTRESNYATNALVFPLTVGMKFKLFEFFETRIFTSYNVITSDYLDNFYNGTDDSYINTGISLHHTFGERYVSPTEKFYQSVDFKSIEEADLDGDGVSDILDECPNTILGMEVTSTGCPLDDDKDGVWNYLDKEENSAPGATVNRDGITLTEEEIQKLYEIREQVHMEKINKFYELPSDEMLQQIASDLGVMVDETGTEKNDGEEAAKSDKLDEKSGKLLVLPMPKEAKFADKNGDGQLQAPEITGAIDDFLEGEMDGNVSDIMKMIEYFFEQ